jgi:hypothetical protein
MAEKNVLPLKGRNIPYERPHTSPSLNEGGISAGKEMKMGRNKVREVVKQH